MLNNAWLQGDGRFRTAYIHLREGSVRRAVGDRVEPGEFPGMAGRTGTHRTHLHFEFMVPGPNPFPQRFPLATTWYAMDPFGVYDRRDASHYMEPWYVDRRIRGIGAVSGWRSEIPLKSLPTYGHSSVAQAATLLL